MKKQIRKRLSLSKETLRNLSEREMAGVVGGITRTCCNSCTDTCCDDDTACVCVTDGCTNVCTQASACC